MVSEEIIQKQKEYLWACVSTYYERPLVVERGQGMYLYDAEGKQYLDYFGGVKVMSVGHGHPKVTAAIMAQLQKIAYTSTLYVNEPQVKLAEKLAQITPGRLKKTYFTNSGTEANETAIVLSRLYTGRQEIVALRHAYHGRSMMAMTVAGLSTWKHGGSYVPGVVHAVSPYCYRCPFKLEYPSCNLACAKDVEEVIQTTTTGEIAAFIAEPIQGAGGYITPPKEYFQEVIPIIRKHGGLFICDEVQTGWGRTSEKWFGIEHWGVEPDIMTFAKGMANGTPIGATIATPEIADAYPKTTFSTFGGNPVSCAAALATIEVIETENLMHNAKVVGDYLRSRLEELKEKYPVIGDVRGMGLMQAIECVAENKAPHPKAALKVLEETKKRGRLIGIGGLYGNVIRISPPLIVTKDQIDELVAALDAAFATV